MPKAVGKFKLMSSANDFILKNRCTLILRVRYQECDAQGIVFNARYGDYADIADTEYFRNLVGNFIEFNQLGFDKRVISYEINWRNAAYFDDVLHLQCETAHVGTTSYAVSIKCSRENGEELQDVADIKITYVIVDAHDYKKTPIPDVLKDGFCTPFDLTVDQSGR